MAVPLSKTQPTQSLEYYVKDSESVAVIATKELVDKVRTFYQLTRKRYRNLNTLPFRRLRYKYHIQSFI